MYFKSGIILAASLLFGLTAHAQKGKKVNHTKPKTWEKIAEKTVDFIRDRDEIKVNGKHNYAYIKLVVTDAPIYLNNLVIGFETGNDQTIEIKQAIKSPGETKTIKVFEPVRKIKRIFLVYSTLPNAMDKRAHLEVYASKLIEKGAVAVVEPEANKGPALVIGDKPGWRSIGTRTLDLNVGRDEITVFGADRFSMIKFRLIGGGVKLINAEFSFESGDSQFIQLDKEMVAGVESALLNLNGGERSLKKISFTYQSGIGNYENEAEMEIWGYKSDEQQSSR